MPADEGAVPPPHRGRRVPRSGTGRDPQSGPQGGPQAGPQAGPQSGPQGSQQTRPQGGPQADGVPAAEPARSGGPEPSPADVTGPQLARAVLDAARARREAGRPRRRTPDGGWIDDEAGGPPRRRLRGYSGPGPDPRDPQLFGAVLGRLMKARGWQKPAAEATVFGAWERVVGPDIAKHSRPVRLDNGELTVEAESTAWAAQLRLLAANLLKSIAAEVGHNVVTKLHIHGPAAPSWQRGPRRVQGRGPRDTYG